MFALTVTVEPYGVEMRQFAAESALFLLPDPGLVLVRTQVLDYFGQTHAGLRDDHVLFRWERSMDVGPAEESLMEQPVYRTFAERSR